jgi:hypothetical protein
MPRDIPHHERPLCERYRLAGRDWAQKRKVYRGYDERKKIVFSELVLALMSLAQKQGNRSTKAQAELEALTSDTWSRYIDQMIEAEHQMNLAEVEKKALEMEQWERNDSNATAREERRSYRTGG